MTKRTPYLYADTDRHGNQRLYFKPPGHRKIRIRFSSGTPEARAEYQRLIKLYEAGHDLGASRKLDTASTEWLLQQYMASRTFADLASNTQIQRRNFFIRFNRAHGRVAYTAINARDLAAVRDQLGPGAGRNFRNAMAAAFKWACSDDVQLMDHNPAAAVAIPKQRPGGYRKWTMEDVLQFKAHHPAGSNPRKALALLLFTAREISGIRELGRAHVRDGLIRGHRQKTWTNNATPLLATLRDELGTDYSDLIWLRASHGGAYSAKSLSQTFTAWARAAGLEGLSSHGLRKSIATILAELGMSERTIMAVLAHTDPRQAQTYVQDANTRALAANGMHQLEAQIGELWRSA